MSNGNGYLTIREVANKLGLKVNSVYKRIYDGSFKTVTRYGILLIAESELDAWKLVKKKKVSWLVRK